MLAHLPRPTNLFCPPDLGLRSTRNLQASGSPTTTPHRRLMLTVAGDLVRWGHSDAQNARSCARFLPFSVLPDRSLDSANPPTTRP